MQKLSLANLQKLLDRPKFQTKIQPRRKESLLELIREKAQFIKLPLGVESVCRDPKDEVYIVCAVVAQVDFLVSGDKDLLVLKQHDGVKITSLQSFVELFE
ncbi:MAG: putative toxin-antitoxin system toxin component, PIN family [Candidatus Melainabacteria bacterium]|nr:putative toxin-antitoxin system toxin component, PIN family [Candidatus Melainabacteria bacterium]